MSLELEYDTIFQVIDTWEQLRRIDNHEEVAGVILFTHLFENCPPAKVRKTLLLCSLISQHPRCT
jgi:hypothetical protein